jgi:type II secretory pathway component PulK
VSRWKKIKADMEVKWGFPMQLSTDGSISQKPENKGISLLIALTTIAMMITMVSDLIVTSSVNLELALNTRDQVRGEYVAKSGFNLALFLITGGYAVDLKKASLPPPIGGKLTDSAASTWQMLNDFPPMGANMVRMLKAGGAHKKDKEKGKKEQERDKERGEDPFHLGGMLSEKTSAQMELFQDQFSIKITDEAGKINLSNLINERIGKPTLDRLVALFSCPAEKEFLESKNLQPQELAYRIFDFIKMSADDASSPESGLASRNDTYKEEKPPYTVKALPLDSVEELRLVKGWDDDIHSVFAPYLTVYPYLKGEAVQESHKININTAPKELMSCLIPSVLKNECYEKYMRKRKELDDEKSPITSGDLNATLKDLFCYTEEDEKSAQSGEKSADTPDQWLTDKTTVLRVVIETKTGNQSHTLVAIVRRIPPQDKGFMRDKQDVKRSYEILSFQLL